MVSGEFFPWNQSSEFGIVHPSFTNSSGFPDGLRPPFLDPGPTSAPLGHRVQRAQFGRPPPAERLVEVQNLKNGWKRRSHAMNRWIFWRNDRWTYMGKQRKKYGANQWIIGFFCGQMIWGSPRAGWFIEKSQSKIRMMTAGTPMTQETRICGNMEKTTWKKWSYSIWIMDFDQTKNENIWEKWEQDWKQDMENQWFMCLFNGKNTWKYMEITYLEHGKQSRKNEKHESLKNGTIENCTRGHQRLVNHIYLRLWFWHAPDFCKVTNQFSLLKPPSFYWSNIFVVLDCIQDL